MGLFRYLVRIVHAGVAGGWRAWFTLYEPVIADRVR